MPGGLLGSGGHHRRCFDQVTLRSYLLSHLVHAGSAPPALPTHTSSTPAHTWPLPGVGGVSLCPGSGWLGSLGSSPNRLFLLQRPPPEPFALPWHDSAIATAFHFLPVLTSISVNDALHTFHYYNDEELILNIGGTRRAWNWSWVWFIFTTRLWLNYCDWRDMSFVLHATLILWHTVKTFINPGKVHYVHLICYKIK